MSFGSRNLNPPTAAEEARIQACKRDGCIACHRLGLPKTAHCGRMEQNHILCAGHRLGHNYSYCVGAWHHQGRAPRGYSLDYMRTLYGPNLRDDKSAFHALFGSDQTLLNLQNDRINYPRESLPTIRELRERGIRNKRRSSQCTASSKTFPRNPT